MVNTTAPRRVSYAIPPPSEPVQHLILPSLGAPRNGRASPLVVPANPPAWSQSPLAGVNPAQQHPRHRLGVASLVVDAATQLLGRDSPEGLLYTGGRDGLVISWELGAHMRKRNLGAEDGHGPGKPKRWDAITGWADEDESDEDSPILDGDVLGQTNRGTKAQSDHLAWEDEWQVDEQGPIETPAAFRQCVQAHTDWVNDLLLCNYNQTVVSASADGTIKAWNPHAPQSNDLVAVGQHSDYVKCLASSRAQPWVASGSFDRTIKLWDLSRATSSTPTMGSHAAHSPSLLAQPISTLAAPDAIDDKGSVYSISADAQGHALASGSPERIVRLWDSRSAKCTGKLVGHTDNIRGLVLSADGRWLLSCSADASIKLWSLASPQRCLHTFSHHLSSVWSIASLHPQLSTFYSGDRDGLLCKVDVGASDDVNEGECVLLAREEHGICAIAPMRPAYNTIGDSTDSSGGRVYVASGSSNVNGWRDTRPRPGRYHSAIMRGELVGSPVSEEGVTPPTQPTSFSPRHRTGNPFGSVSHPSPRPGVSISSLADVEAPRGQRYYRASSPTASQSTHEHEVDTTAKLDTIPELLSVPVSSLIRLGPPADAYRGYPGGYGGMYQSQQGHGGKRDADANTLYSTASIRSGVNPRMQFSPNSQSFNHSLRPLHTTTVDATDENSPYGQYLAREVASEAKPLFVAPLETIGGSVVRGIVRSILLNDRIHALTVDTAGEVRLWDVVRCVCKGVFVGQFREGEGERVYPIDFSQKSPREALEDVRELIEGEVVANAWATVDTRIGELTVHMREAKCFEAEVYADESGYGSERAFEDDLRLNIGKWVLSNLFASFVREQARRVGGGEDPLQPPCVAAPLPTTLAPPANPSLARDFSQTLKLTFDNHRARAMSDLSTSGRITAGTLPTPGFGIMSMVSPAMTPAVIPEGATTPGPSNLVQHKENKPLPTIQLSSVPESSPAVLTGGTVSPSTTVTTATPAAASVVKKTDQLDYFGTTKGRRPSTAGSEGGDEVPKPTKEKEKEKEEPAVPQTPNTGLKRFRLFARSSKRPLSGEGIIGDGGKGISLDLSNKSEPEPEPWTFTAQLPKPLALPTANDAPPLYLPLHTGIMISEETSDTASGLVVLYRGSVGDAGEGTDLESVERAMPTWLIDYLFGGKIPPESSKAASGSKISFILTPWTGGEPVEIADATQGQSKLTASRFLRVKKVANYARENLQAKPSSRPSTATANAPPTPEASSTQLGLSPPQPTNSANNLAAPRSASPNRSSGASVDDNTPELTGDPSLQYELVCNDVVLPGEMTLAAVRQYVWKQASDLVLQYRRKATTPVAEAQTRTL